MIDGYYRFPTIHAETIVFVAEDDLWHVARSGGIARRLTSNLGPVTFPALSPDGQWLAFVGREEGAPEVFVMPAEGGPAQRLTYLANHCQVLGWLDGERILFASGHQQINYRELGLFTIGRSTNNGAVMPLPYGPVRAAAFGPAGQVVLGRNSGDPARWKRYRGGTAGHLWIDLAGDGNFERLLPALAGNIASPLWLTGAGDAVAERIFFVSDHEGIANLYSITLAGDDLRRHTHHEDFFVRNPASDGRRIVYHAGADLYVFDPLDETSVKVPVDYRSPRIQRNRKFVYAGAYIDDASLSPTGDVLSLTARGKSYAFFSHEGPVLQVGKREGVRYRLPEWLNDSRRLVMIDDQEGEETLIVHTGDPDEEPLRLSGLDIGRVDEIRVAPANEKKQDRIALSNHRGELLVVELASRELKVVDRSLFGHITGFDWSPDGNWLAYGFKTSAQTSEIRLCRVAGAGEVPGAPLYQPISVTRPVLRDVGPSFDPDGRFLYFLSYREFNPVYDNLHLDLNFPWGMRPYLITLQASTLNPFVPRPGEGDDGRHASEEVNDASESGKAGAAAAEDESDAGDDEEVDGDDEIGDELEDELDEEEGDEDEELLGDEEDEAEEGDDEELDETEDELDEEDGEGEEDEEEDDAAQRSERVRMSDREWQRRLYGRTSNASLWQLLAPTQGRRLHATTSRTGDEMVDPTGGAKPPGSGGKQDDDDKSARTGEEKGKDGKGKGKRKKRRLRIDLAGIERRLIPFPVADSRYGQIEGVPGKALFTTIPLRGTLDNGSWEEDESEEPETGTLKAWNFKEFKAETIADNVVSFALSRNRKKLLYYSGRRLRVINAGEKPASESGPGRRTGWVELNRVKISVEPQREWEQMYREAWRLQRDHFWTEDMGQIDWNMVYERYLPLISRVSTRGEFSDLLWEMQGELGTSHAYEYGGDYRFGPYYTQGFLGADATWDEVAGGYRLTNFVVGDPWDPDATSPLTAPGIDVKEGDLLIAINGQRLDAEVSPQQLLVTMARQEILLTFAPRPEDLEADAEEGATEAPAPGDVAIAAAVVETPPAAEAGDDGVEPAQPVDAVEDAPAGNGEAVLMTDVTAAPAAGAPGTDKLGGEKDDSADDEDEDEDEEDEEDDDKRFSVIVKTLSSETAARYRAWVEANRAAVHAATEGRIGYVHIPDMGPRGYAEFHRGYLAETARDGLIIDVRYNGGGHVSQLLLEKLARRRIGYDVTRWGGVMPYPSDSVAGPLVTLTNEHAGSDGDIFCHGFKLLKLGPLVGKRTWGGVIGVSPRHSLVDGTVTTQPEYSFWFEDVGYNVENYGTDPDIDVDIRPQEYAAGRDPQLERAIVEALRLLAENPPIKPDLSKRPSRALPKLPPVG